MKSCREKGSFTVEMIIIFPVILLTILGMIYISIVHYQNIVTTVAAMQTTSKSSIYWNQLGGDISWYKREFDGVFTLATRPNYTDNDPYSDLFDTQSSNRKENTEKYMSWVMLGNPNVFRELETTGTPEASKSGFLQKYITVSIERSYINPLGNLLERVGIYSEQTNTITASAPLCRPAEFIRNASFVEELINGRGKRASQ